MDLNTQLKGMHHCKPNGLHDLAKHVVVNFDSGTWLELRWAIFSRVQCACASGNCRIRSSAGRPDVRLEQRHVFSSSMLNSLRI